MRSNWALDPQVVFLNHGSFGACPREVLACQRNWRDQLEQEPVQFFLNQYTKALDEARAKAAAFVGAAPENFVFVPNATHGVNAVLGSISLQPGDELLTTNHVYGACLNALHAVSERSGARVVLAQIPLPLQDEAQVVDAILECVNARTRLALIDHVTSATGIVLPIEAIVLALRSRGVEVLVDGAHAPGMLPLEVEALGAAYYTGNFHKWVCAPKGSAFLHARPDLQASLRPLVVSHGRTAARGRRPFWENFDWPGTADPSAWLSVPFAIDYLDSCLPQGWPAVRAANHTLLLQARALLCERLSAAPPADERFLGSLATIPLPPASQEHSRVSAFDVSPLQQALFGRHRIEVPVFDWPGPEQRWVRISAHLYNELWEYEQLAHALGEELARGL